MANSMFHVSDGVDTIPAFVSSYVAAVRRFAELTGKHDGRVRVSHGKVTKSYLIEECLP